MRSSAFPPLQTVQGDHEERSVTGGSSACSMHGERWSERCAAASAPPIHLDTGVKGQDIIVEQRGSVDDVFAGGRSGWSGCVGVASARVACCEVYAMMVLSELAELLGRLGGIEGYVACQSKSIKVLNVLWVQVPG